MKEASKAVVRRLADVRYATRFFVGTGIDIGAGSDPVSLYTEQFPLMTGLRVWDMPDGDAQKLASIQDSSLDFVHSSHCLEHMVDPMAALARWFGVLKPGGHMVLLFPDEDMYEQGIWPSNKNHDHKWTFAIYKKKSWSPKSLNVLELVAKLPDAAELVKLEKLDASYRYNLPPLDQTLTPVGECAIEMVIRKRLPAEIAAGGRLPRQGTLSAAEIHALTGLNVGAQPKTPAQIAALVAQALQRHQAQDYDAAEKLYREAIAADSKNFDATHLLGVLRRQRGDSEGAVALIRKAIELQPLACLAHTHLGNALRDLERVDEALAAYEAALKIDPNFADAIYNRGNQRLETLDTKGALADFARAMKIDPQHMEAHLHASFVHLMTGDFERGWPLYEWRWREDSLARVRREYGVPRWTGDGGIDGKRIFVYAEQGFGDTIQFARYIELLAKRGAFVVLEVPAALLLLFKSLAGVGQLIAEGDPIPPIDLHCPLLSLPLAFKTDLRSIPAGPAYLRADPGAAAAWAKRLPPIAGKRIGFACSGRAAHKNDRNRTIKLADFMAIAGPSQQFVCLQNELREEDAAWLRARSDVVAFSSDLKTFADTAALIQTLDAVATVDTSIAHLAGALGKPTFVLVPFKPDWRWLLQRQDSPWYPSMRLFRQHKPRDWQGALGDLRAALQG
jgi:tetratricopeptide (TPR) repeat protein